MELEFDRDVIQGCEVLADGTVCQEETLESIVPDACPDILRIVAVCGQAGLNGKQAKEGMAQASGTVRAVILYQPEAGGGLRRHGGGPALHRPAGGPRPHGPGNGTGPASACGGRRPGP